MPPTNKGIINALLHVAEKLEVITQFGSNGKGAYAGGTQYQKGDLVSYSGLAYIAILATLGNLPTNTTYWQQITVTGATGAMGPAGAIGPVGATWRGAWSGATNYAVNDIVSLSGSAYICILLHTNHTPPNATYWSVVASKGDTGATGAMGPAGPIGADGAIGADGTNAVVFNSGAGAPAGGADNDWYLNTTNGDLYKKTAGTWNIIDNITGPTGAAGTNGTNGTNGLGVPAGGTTGQVLAKQSNTDNDTIWTASASDPATAIHSATGKTTPVDADELGIVDSTGSWVLKKLTWANLKATLKTYFDTLYSTAAKATGTEINTGTNDTKFATPKALKDREVAFRAKLTTNQAIANFTWVKVQFPTEDFDVTSNYDNTTNYRFTAPVTGYYLVNAGVVFAANTTNVRAVAIYVNNTVKKIVQVVAFSSGSSFVPIVDIILLSETDYVEIFCLQNIGSSLNVGPDGNSNESTMFAMSLLGV